MAQFLLTEFLGLPTLRSIISDISSTILQILVPIWLQKTRLLIVQGERVNGERGKGEREKGETVGKL